MIEPIVLGLAFLAGIVLGFIFFGGLWLTVGKALVSPQPGLWFVCSMVLRTGIILVGFYYVLGGHWQRLIFCLIGFLVARVVVTRWTRPTVLAQQDLHGGPSNVA